MTGTSKPSVRWLPGASLAKETRAVSTSRLKSTLLSVLIKRMRRRQGLDMIRAALLGGSGLQLAKS